MRIMNTTKKCDIKIRRWNQHDTMVSELPKALLLGQKAKPKNKKNTQWPTWVNFCFLKKKLILYWKKKRSFSLESFSKQIELKKKIVKIQPKKIIEFWMGLRGSRDHLLWSKANTWWWHSVEINVSWEMNYLYKGWLNQPLV